MNRIKLLQFVLLSALFIFVSACGSKSGDSTDQSSEFEKAEGEQLKDQIEDVVYNIPSPSEIPYMLQSTGAEFNQALLNSREKASTYTTTSEKTAMNLGIYSTDIGYLISYGKVQDALNYITTSKSLADQLGIIGAFEQSVLVQFEKNLGNMDSLALLLNGAINKTSNFLKDDDRNKLAALLLSGSLIEGLYISCELIRTYPTDILSEEERTIILTELIRVILEQEKSVNDIIKMLSTIEDSETVNELLVDFKSLEESYSKLDIQDKIQNNQGNLVFTDENLKNITENVSKLRNRIAE